MKSVKYESFEKEYPRAADEFVTDQKIAVTFLNSPVRGNWMTILDLSDKEIKAIEKIIGRYAKKKIEQEKKKKPRTRLEVIRIENEIFERMFQGKVYKVRHRTEQVPDKVEAVETVGKILKKEYPKAAILDLQKLGRLATLCSLGEEMPSEFMVFDPEKMKIISVEVIAAD